MKFAVLSDIHSNVFALEAVLADAKKHSVDLIINLGDILYGPIAPKATYDLLMQHDIVTICGNQDRQIFAASVAEIASNPTMKFIIDNLGEAPIKWMKSLPFDKQLNNDVYLCHGTPSDDLIYLLENVELGYACLRSDSEIIKRLNGQKSTLICCGHTHTPRTVSLTTGQVIINPGSVGLQAYTDDEPNVHSMENFNAMASYAVIEKTINSWNVEHINVPYDIELAVAECKKRDRMDWVHFLTTGRKV
ncbi:MAG: metallophosphoesterase family protein [Colwellia sp.]|nr:metallophosphoesterase family protein [Colwellia sp.]